MPLNEIEQHPYLDYFITYNNNNVDWAKYNKMIIGSFPVYGITETIYPYSDKRHLECSMQMPFFYGSQTNEFWSHLVKAIDDRQWISANNPKDTRNLAIKYLEQHGILLTDVISRTNRFAMKDDLPSPFSTDDSALLNLSAERHVVDQFALNQDVIDWLIKAVNIDSLYFTAQGLSGKTPGGWFHQILNRHNIEFEVLYQSSNAMKYRMRLNDRIRVFKLFYLPTPSSYRSLAFTIGRQHPMFVNYLMSHHPTFYQSVVANNFDLDKTKKSMLTSHRNTFIQLWWKQYLLRQNVYFDGSVYS